MQLLHFPFISIPIPSPESLFIYKDNEANDHYFQHLCDWDIKGVLNKCVVHLHQERRRHGLHFQNSN